MNCTIAIILVQLFCGAFTPPIDSTDAWIENYHRTHTPAEQYYLCTKYVFIRQSITRGVSVGGKQVRHLTDKEWDRWCKVLLGPNGDVIWNGMISFRAHRFAWDRSHLDGLHRCEWDDAIDVAVKHTGVTVSMCLFVRDIERISGPIPYDWQDEKYGMPSDYDRWRVGYLEVAQINGPLHVSSTIYTCTEEQERMRRLRASLGYPNRLACPTSWDFANDY